MMPWTSSLDLRIGRPPLEAAAVVTSMAETFATAIVTRETRRGKFGGCLQDENHCVGSCCFGSATCMVMRSPCRLSVQTGGTGCAQWLRLSPFSGKALELGVVLRWFGRTVLDGTGSALLQRCTVCSTESGQLSAGLGAHKLVDEQDDCRIEKVAGSGSNCPPF